MGKIITLKVKVKLQRINGKVEVTKMEEAENFETETTGEEATWENGDDILILAKNIGEYNLAELDKCKMAMFDSENYLETTVYEKRIV